METAKTTITFDLPTIWLHGSGYAKKAGEILNTQGASRPLIITDRNLYERGSIQTVITALESLGLKYEICCEAQTEPRANDFDELAQRLNLSRFDSIISVGGGSVIDTAKGLTVIATWGGSILDYDGWNDFAHKPNWTHIAIPTTAGTGSEVSDGGVFVDEARNTKFIVISKKICPTFALTDPEMSRGMPPKVTACSGADALSHAIESYLSKNADAASEMFSLKAIELISRHLPKAYADGNDMAARNAMQIGATMAMIAGSNVYLGLAHSIDMPLGGIFHMPHGQACSMPLPAVLRYNTPAVPDKITNVFKIMGLWDATLPADEAFEQGYAGMAAFLNNIGISTHLADFGYNATEHLDSIVKSTLESAQCNSNPRKPTGEDVAEILRNMI